MFSVGKERDSPRRYQKNVHFTDSSTGPLKKLGKISLTQPLLFCVLKLQKIPTQSINGVFNQFVSKNTEG